MMAKETSDAAAIRRALEGLGLAPDGVDLAWIARVKHDTERQIAEHRQGAAFATAITLATVPTSD
jgi:hypothetical protein